MLNLSDKDRNIEILRLLKEVLHQKWHAHEGNNYPLNHVCSFCISARNIRKKIDGYSYRCYYCLCPQILCNKYGSSGIISQLDIKTEYEEVINPCVKHLTDYSFKLMLCAIQTEIEKYEEVLKVL